MEFLASDCAAAKEMLRRYVFFVVPVLNPDGGQWGKGGTGAQGQGQNMKNKSSDDEDDEDEDDEDEDYNDDDNCEDADYDDELGLIVPMQACSIQAPSATNDQPDDEATATQNNWPGAM